MRTLPNLIQRARAGMALTPAERALLRLLEGLLCAALVAAAPIIAQALSQQSVNWGDVARAALAAAAKPRRASDSDKGSRLSAWMIRSSIAAHALRR